MNKMWGLVFFVLPLAGLAYVFWRTWWLLPLSGALKAAVLGAMLLCFLMIFCYFGGALDKMPMSLATAVYEIGNASIFVMLYLVMLYGLLDLGRAVHLVPHSLLFHSLKGSLMVTGVMLLVFGCGYVHYMHKERCTLSLDTQKTLEQPLKILMASDLHAGYLNREGELNRWINFINKENADIILIGGDIIDGSVRALREEHAAEAFRRLNAPVVACLGNHEYYAGIDSALAFYRKAGITLLRDSAVTIKGINIIGRDDRTNRSRKPIGELKKGLDMSRYTILLDHQPYNLEQAEQAGIDFQFSGHTHYGQMWPISWITDAIYEDAFGPLRKGNTQYYVSSGLGIWGAKFRIGTRSEYIVATLKNRE